MSLDRFNAIKRLAYTDVGTDIMSGTKNL